MKILKLLLCTIALGLVPWLAMAADAPPAAEVVAAATNAVTAAVAPAAPAPDPTATLKIGLDTVWVLVTAALVFWMNAGFACVESGMCQSKNTANILAKNFVVFACASLSYYFIGWGLMFGDGNGFMGMEGISMLKGEDNSPATGADYKGVYDAISWTGVPLFAKFFFQLVFAGTAATIVSGAVAERIKFGSFVVFSFILVAFLYPITGHWIWGGGWLQTGGFWDFAGSTVVHSMGGWAALAGVLVLGARKGKFSADGKVHPFPGHSIAMSTIGVFILWLGWFGFNPGSTMAVGDGKAMAHIFVTTNTAAVTGIITSMLTAWFLLGKPDVSMVLNGCLAGLVAITAPCAYVTVPAAIIIGGVAGVLVVISVLFFDKMRIDDPVGALSVHLANGVWGTLALGLFADATVAKEIAGIELVGGMKQFLIQFKGVAAVGVFTFVISYVVWQVLKVTMGLRVTAEEEQEGLDIGEHGNEAYPDFVINSK